MQGVLSVQPCCMATASLLQLLLHRCSHTGICLLDRLRAPVLRAQAEVRPHILFDMIQSAPDHPQAGILQPSQSIPAASRQGSA